MWKVLTAVLACTALARAQPPGMTQAHADIANAARRFADAAAKGKVAELSAFLQVPVGYGGLWFSDPTCQRSLRAGMIEPKSFSMLAQCLATLPLQISTRVGSFADSAVFSYAPGIELEARFYVDESKTVLRWIGFVARRDLADGLPTITSDALEAVRTGGTRAVLPGDGARAILDREIKQSTRAYAYAWLKVCLDAKGAVTGAHAREASSDAAVAAFTAAIADWTFKPFVFNGSPLPVCSVLRFAYPAEKAPAEEQLPLPLGPTAPPTEAKPQQPTSLMVKPQELAPLRIKGEKVIEPDDDTKFEISKAGGGPIVATWKLCVDELGHVSSITLVKSSGYSAYDKKLANGLGTWAFRPYVVDGKPIAVCTEIKFIYSQR